MTKPETLNLCGMKFTGNVMLCYVNTGKEVRWECESPCSQTDAIYEPPYGLTDSIYVTSGSLMDVTCGSPCRDAHYEPTYSQTDTTFMTHCELKNAPYGSPFRDAHFKPPCSQTQLT
jgi:hypothetical protein